MRAVASLRFNQAKKDTPISQQGWTPTTIQPGVSRLAVTTAPLPPVCQDLDPGDPQNQKKKKKKKKKKPKNQPPKDKFRIEDVDVRGEKSGLPRDAQEFFEKAANAARSGNFQVADRHLESAKAALGDEGELLALFEASSIYLLGAQPIGKYLGSWVRTMGERIGRFHNAEAHVRSLGIFPLEHQATFHILTAHGLPKDVDKATKKGIARREQRLDANAKKFLEKAEELGVVVVEYLGLDLKILDPDLEAFAKIFAHNAIELGEAFAKAKQVLHKHDRARGSFFGAAGYTRKDRSTPTNREDRFIRGLLQNRFTDGPGASQGRRAKLSDAGQALLKRLKERNASANPPEAAHANRSRSPEDEGFDKHDGIAPEDDSTP